MSFSLASLINRMRGQPENFEGYAQTRLGRQPQIYARNQQQFDELTNPLHDPRKSIYGATFMGKGDVGAANVSPLADPVRALLSQGEPVSVISPNQKPVSGPGGTPGTEPGVPLHEATHQFTKGLPLKQIYQQLGPDVQNKMEQSLQKSGYSKDDIPGEVASRLVAGQFGSLGLTAQEGMYVRQAYFTHMQNVAPKQAQRLQMYTKGRTPATALDQYGVSRTDESRNPATGIHLTK